MYAMIRVIECGSLKMPPREEFPSGRKEGAPSDDIGWHFADPVPSKGRNCVACKLCGKVISNGITRLKEHIAHVPGEVKGCARVDSFVRESGGMSSVGGRGAPHQRQESDLEHRLRSVDVDLTRSKSMKQPKIKGGGVLKTLRKKLGEAVSKLIIYERLPMNLSNSPWLHNLLTAAADLGPGIKYPTPYEISSVYLENEFKCMKSWINELKPTWKERGVTIMCDGWTNGINHMHIMNFLVYCSKGTVFLKSIDASSVASRNTEYYFSLLDKVVEEVGEENVVQVVTDNEKALKAAGLKLMEKRPHLFWSACAAHCLDLCLEDIGKKSNVQKVLDDAKKVTLFIYNHIWTVSLMKKYTRGREIIRPAITRFATQFMQVESIVAQKQALKNMFDSNEFNDSKWGKEKSGPAFEAKQIVKSDSFWSKAADIMKVFEPIVKVLKLVDGDEKPTMGFVYEAIDRAKLAIEKNCRYHSHYTDIVDKRWHFMHSDLHSAGYFLNPQFQFGVVHGSDVAKETMDGTTKMISRIEPNIDNQIKAINQLLLFRDKQETFGTLQAQRAWCQMNPAEWWMVYGSCAHELQTIAIKVLSQTTSASNCERNWSTFSYIHTKTRNRLKYQRLQKLVFTFYNMKLKMRHTMRRSQEEIERSFNPINLDYIFQEEDHLAPWLEEREGPLLDGMQNEEWLPIDSDDDNEEAQPGEKSDSSQPPTQGDEGGLSPPSGNSGSGSGSGGGDASDSVIGGSSRRGRAKHGKNKRSENVALDDSSSSSVAQSSTDFCKTWIFRTS
ncbi:uncharacterized protein LOC130744147 [Lotus japonicus]|uniref:uncharacterized protein LOC130744147 n=1 Tax=Lotus japonicus TaxID=34305 RepID=UPI00258A49C2|nr:uncharacterized protein LOC130744147 [Lotus japonicus]